MSTSNDPGGGGSSGTGGAHDIHSMQQNFHQQQVMNKTYLT